MKLFINTDGGSRGNPGPSGYGAVIKDELGVLVCVFGEYIGHTTNNVAEYVGAISGVLKAFSLGATEVELRVDSQLVAYQINGFYKVNHEMQPFYQQLRKALTFFQHWNVKWISREQNQLADKECNHAIKERRARDPRRYEED